MTVKRFLVTIYQLQGSLLEMRLGDFCKFRNETLRNGCLQNVRVEDKILQQLSKNECMETL